MQNKCNQCTANEGTAIAMCTARNAFGARHGIMPAKPEYSMKKKNVYNAPLPIKIFFQVQLCRNNIKNSLSTLWGIFVVKSHNALAKVLWVKSPMCTAHRLINIQIGHTRDFTWYRGQRPSPARVILSHERVQIHARENLCSYATNPPHFCVRELLLCDI